MNKRTRHRRHIWLLLFAIAAGVLILCAAVLISGGGSAGLDMAWRQLASSVGGRTTATEFTYARAEDAFFAPVGGGFAIADGDGVRYVEGSGEETTLASDRISTPAGDTNGTECLMYDLGGRFLCVLDASGLIWQDTTPGTLFGADINEAGWVAALTKYDGYNGAVTVYNAKGEAVYRWYCGSGYLTGAALSPGCDSLAVLTVGSEGSTIHFLRLDSETEQNTYTAEGTVIVDLCYTTPGTLSAVTAMGLITVSGEGEVLSSLQWGGTLAAYSDSGDGYTAAAWNRSQSGTAGGLETVDSRGEVISRLEVTGTVISLSAAGRYIAVRFADRVAVYNKHLELMYETAGMADTVAVLAQQDGSFFAAGETAAELYGK